MTEREIAYEEDLAEEAWTSSTQLQQRISELEAGIMEARRCLAKGRALWNGPCHECDGVLAALLSLPTTEPAKAEETLSADPYDNSRLPCRVEDSSATSDTDVSHPTTEPAKAEDER